MLDGLRTEQAFPGSVHLDRLTTAEVLALMNSADAEIAASVQRELPRIALAVDAISSRARSGWSFGIYRSRDQRPDRGAGCVECPPTFGVAPDLVRGIIAGGEGALARASEASEDDPAAGAADLAASGFRTGDVLVGISASGRTPYVLGAVAKAREMGAVTCGISCTPDSELSRAVDYPMEPAPGPEVIAGSTRLRAGTATKMVLNMISTAVMIRLGHVYGNLMVNVAAVERKAGRSGAADHRPSQPGSVTSALRSCSKPAGGSVRTAIVMENRKIGRREAEQLLADDGGRLAEALK